MSRQEKDQATLNHIVALNSDIRRYLNLAPHLKPVASGQGSNHLEKNSHPTSKPQPKRTP